jgi:hypothetical protein
MRKTDHAVDDIGDSAVAHSACAALNFLIAACKRDMIAHNAVATTVVDPELRERLIGQARRRTVFVNSLRVGIMSLGKMPHQPLGMRLFRESILNDMRGNTEAIVYAVCARVTSATEDACIAALGLPMPLGTRSGIEHELAEIRANRRELEVRGRSGPI